MANSFVGSLPPVGANNGGNVTLTFSNLRDEANAAVTLQQGDLVVCAYASSGTADLAMSTSSSGWTEVTEVYANGTLDTNLAVYWKIMGASPDTSFVAVGPGGSSNGTIGVAFAFRGQHATTPFAIAATTATGTGTSVPNAASITPTTAGSWPIVIGAGTAAAGAVFSHTDLSSTTNHFRSGNHAETNDIAIGLGIKTNWSSGAFDPAVWTGGNVNASNSWATISLVLEPAAAVSHAATGALTGPGSALAGSATRFRAHAATGALSGPGATIAGSAARAGPAVSHAASGALSGPGSILAGSAARTRQHAASGTLSGGGAILAGSSARLRAHASSGVLAGQGAVIVGSALRDAVAFACVVSRGIAIRIGL